ncbi:F-box domain, Leucine-rich repeat domain, L domain-like protein [Artemisia annua]|uniref:F-box domain, Leucine-rich repeat domain, L domain-like protein n=1 Tax=Artemisia annua TaxID=35608 RepID=A0A2U1LW56_ARTAN|nr:F-box domain, Leucine-rich repeat domain, L domain-like protein [Artemisia annua]
MNEIEKSPETNNPTSLNHLRDELILQILTRITDLKTLFICHVVSKRISSITLHIHTISFTAANVTISNNPNNFSHSLLNTLILKPLHFIRRAVLPPPKPLPPIISLFYDHSFRSAFLFLTKFRFLKTLLVELPYSRHKGVDDSSLYKWKVGFDNKIDSLIFVLPNFVSYNYSNNMNELCESTWFMNDAFRKKVHIPFQCLKDVIVRHRMLLYFIKEFPLLERVAISDSVRCGRLSLSGGRVPVSVSTCYVDVLDLARSGCVMRDVTFVVMEMSEDIGSVTGDYEFKDEDEEEGVYSEAVIEILENHKDKMKKLL